ncbi:hypothetical protein BABINDRAFT_31849 [Babjeviella inositovora NRRL Y-12698]|uniref:Protein transport protein SFT2 n=1 Tax=Babjeviella inositovora NRRL Y-12698 TaxID=984486 RepID=A0A1E3QVW7_9ASCO|nr:uncharacterized protein BABINDRAFT_31849 [Babjeviella inositovora NRRL Y-12698]ODQ81798.1 hypothetical protein BABINDRAFT_31849 [Babjeviella inositovora NRRL Y-12698]
MSSETERNFRNQFARWSSANPPSSETAQENGGIGGMFSSFTSKVSSGANDMYSRLPLYNGDGSEAPAQEPEWFQLSRFEKLLVFSCCLLGSAACFLLGFFLFPVLALKPRKFGLLWSLGSLLFVVSFGALQGPVNYIQHLISKDRLPFTVIFFGSVISTIYFAVVVKSSILTLLSGIMEVLAVIYYTMSYFPFGAQSFQWFLSVAVSSIRGSVGI